MWSPRRPSSRSQRLSPAPINGSGGPHKWYPEQSQARLAKETAYNGAYAPVGKVIVKETPATPDRPAPLASPESIARAGDRLASPDAGVFAAATARVDREAHARRTPLWIIALLVSGGVFGLYRGFRVWVDRTIPVG